MSVFWQLCDFLVLIVHKKIGEHGVVNFPNVLWHFVLKINENSFDFNSNWMLVTYTFWFHRA